MSNTVNLTYQTFVQIMPASSTAHASIQTGRVAWFTGAGAPASVDADGVGWDGRGTVLAASASLATWAAALNPDGASVVVKDD